MTVIIWNFEMRRVLIQCGGPRTWALLLIALILFLIAMFGGCVTYRLEGKLPKDIAKWYNDHSLIMESPLPGNYKGTEKMYFLRLPPELQRKYVGWFWKVRDLRAREIYESRLAWIKRTHLARDLREAAWVFLLNGYPDDVYGRDEEGQWFFGSGLLDNQGRREGIIYWRYYFPDGEFAEYAFHFSGDYWQPEPLGVVELNQGRRLEELNMTFFSVTWVGFDEWMEAMKR